MGMQLAQPLIIAAVALVLGSGLASCGTGGPGNSSHTKQLWRPTRWILYPPRGQERQQRDDRQRGRRGTVARRATPNKSGAIVK